MAISLLVTNISRYSFVWSVAVPLLEFRRLLVINKMLCTLNLFRGQFSNLSKVLHEPDLQKQEVYDSVQPPK